MHLIEAYCTLNEEQEKQIQTMLEVCKKEDGYEEPLQMSHRFNPHEAMPSWFLAYVDGQLAGVLSIFQVYTAEAEISGCIIPEHRGRGIWRALSRRALETLKKFHAERVLWTTDERSVAANQMLVRAGFDLHQTEYALKYPHHALRDVIHSDVHQLVPIELKDLGRMAAIQASAFAEKVGEAEAIAKRLYEDPTRENWLLLFQGQAIGAVSVFLNDDGANFNAVAVEQSFQGGGHGKILMQLVMQKYLDQGKSLSLDVNSINAKAYNLYRKLGFETHSAVNFYLQRL